MKRVIEHVKTHGQKIHSHVKKHHKKYLFGLVSAALLFKIVPLMIASMFTTKLHFSFADDILGLDSPEIVAVEEPEVTPSEEAVFDEEDEFNLLNNDPEIDTDDVDSDLEVLTNYDEDMVDAFIYARAKGLTTMLSIDNAAMYGNVSRIAFLRMMYMYAENVYHLTGDTTKNCEFSDVSSALDEQYTNAVTRACQLGLIGINEGALSGTVLNPNNAVTRDYFGTILSRIINRNSEDFDNLNDSDPYYTKHLQYLKNEGLLDDISNPDTQEIRGYIFWVLMNADENYTPEISGCTDTELLNCALSEHFDECITTCTGDTEDVVDCNTLNNILNLQCDWNKTTASVNWNKIEKYLTIALYDELEEDWIIKKEGINANVDTNYSFDAIRNAAPIIRVWFDDNSCEPNQYTCHLKNPFVEIQQLAPIPGTSYTGPSINFRWSGDAETEFYSGYKIKIYSGSDCSGTAIITTGVSLNTTGIRLAGFSSGNYCWSIAASGSELIGTISTGFTVIPESINGECSANDIRIISPLNGEIIRKTKQLSWEFIGDDCDGRNIIVSQWTGTALGYVDVRSGEVPTATGYLYDSTGVSEGKLAIYLSEGTGNKISVKEFDIDNVAPTITGVRYEFDRLTTGGHFGANHNLTISFTGSEELTGITVNVMGKNAQFDSVRGLKYTYKTSFTGNVNTGTLQFRISYSDLAGNTGSDYTKNDTGLVFDDEAPSISGSVAINLNRGTRKVTINVSLTKTGKVTLYYNMTGGSSRKSSSSTGYLKNFRWTSNKLKEDKRYNYRLLLEDSIGNKRYYGGSFMVTTGGNLQTGSVRSLESFNTGHTTTSLMSQLRTNLSQYNSCKNRVSTDTITIALTKNNYNKKLKVEMPRNFGSGTLTKKATTLAATIATSLDNKYRSQDQLDTISKDLSNYLMVVKLVVDDGNKCKQNMTRIYVTKLLTSLKEAGLIN